MDHWVGRPGATPAGPDAGWLTGQPKIEEIKSECDGGCGEVTVAADEARSQSAKSFKSTVF